MHLAENRGQWQGCVSMAVNLCVPQKAGSFLNS
jgi:hypothetical protein